MVFHECWAVALDLFRCRACDFSGQLRDAIWHVVVHQPNLVKATVK